MSSSVASFWDQNYTKIIAASSLVIGSSFALIWGWKEMKVRKQLSSIEIGLVVKTNSKNAKYYEISDLCKIQSLTIKIAQDKYGDIVTESRIQRRQAQEIEVYVDQVKTFLKEYQNLLSESEKVLDKSKILSRDIYNQSMKESISNEQLRSSLQQDIANLKLSIESKHKLDIKTAFNAYSFMIGSIQSLSGQLQQLINVLGQRKEDKNYYYGIIYNRLLDQLNQSSMFKDVEEEDLLQAELLEQQTEDKKLIQQKRALTSSIFALMNFIISK